MRSEKGQATVELALGLTVVALLLFGMIDFGQIMHAKTILNHAGREAARAASLGGTDADIRDAALRSASGLSTDKIVVAIQPGPAERKRGTYANVELRYSISIETPLMAGIIPNPFPVKASASMRME